MKVRKAIKRIAAMGIGATMMGATLMGAMAADLSDYPNMFIKDGQFDGVLVVGKNAQAIDTIGVTNIALGLQKAAVTKTLVCGDATSTTTTVSGEQIKIDKTGDDLNIGENLSKVQTVNLDDGDLPSILADGEYNENEGETDNDVTYEQEIELLDHSGLVVFDQDDQDAPEAGVFLMFPKNDDIYSYTLDFDDDVEYEQEGADPDEDLESTTIEIQGQKYTITKAEFTGVGVLDKLTLLVGESILWLAEGETVTKEVDGVEHTIKMVDVADSASSCGIEVDGSTVWIDEDDTETISGVTIGVTEAREVNVDKADADICKVFIGANELVLEEGKEVELSGDDVEGSEVLFTSADNGGTADDTWSALEITYDPSDDIFMAAGDEFVDPVFGNFKFIMGGEVAVHEEIMLEASGNKATLTFMNFDEQEVEIPFVMNEANGQVFTGDDEDLADEGFYLEGDSCIGGSDITDCVGAKFLAVTSGDVAHVIEIASMDDLANTDPELDFDDLTEGTSTDNKDYGNASSACTGTEFLFQCTIALGSGIGDIVLDFNTTTNNVTFTDIVDGGVIKTEFEGEIAIVGPMGGRGNVTFMENDDEGNEVQVRLPMAHGTGSDSDLLELQAPVDTGAGSGALQAAVDTSDSNDDDQLYHTFWGSIISHDSDNKDDVTIMHPEEQLYVEVFVAETGATTTETSGAGEGCTLSEKVNPIPATANKFDTEISSPGAQNLISVGGPCANSVSSALLGNPEVCWEGFEAGKAMLKLVESGVNVALIIAGGEGPDTQLASRILQEFENYDLSGSEMVATTVSASGLSVSPVMMDDAADDAMDDTAEE